MFSGRGRRLSASQEQPIYNILMIAPTSFFADYGCHVRILEEARILQARGHRVTICTYHNGQDVPGLEISRTPPIPWREDYEVGSSRHKIGFDLLLAFKVLATALVRRPDVIHAHLHEGALIGNVVGRVLRIPCVFDFQGSMTAEMVDHQFLRPDGPVFGFWRWLEEGIVRMSRVILTSSQHAVRMLEADFACPSEQLYSVPDCVDADAFHPPTPDDVDAAALRARLGIPAGKRVVVYLGLLADWQGIDLLLQAAHRLAQRRDDVHFLVMGFPNVEHYRYVAQTLGLDGHVTFTGKVPYAEAPRLLQLGEVAVAPKISATEGSGKILNYMAVGLPTVAFDTPVSREYLADLGFYARRGDAEALAAALAAALDDPPRARQVGTSLRERVLQHYSWDQAAETILAAYRVAGARPRTPRGRLM
jgi:glycosyltransferase involved in cell wall biosynthesis